MLWETTQIDKAIGLLCAGEKNKLADYTETWK